MTLATWNVNSIRARQDRLVAWLTTHDVDVLAVQETKVADGKFPYEVITDLGYEVAHAGTSAWNGVAVLSRVGLTDVRIGLPGAPAFGDPAVVEARAIGAVCGGVRVWSLYVPNGRALGDPHYAYKLEWLAALRAHGAAELAADPAVQLAFCGDFNIAPTDDDVWDMAAFVDSTHVSGPERQAFADLLTTGFTDVVRPFAPGPGTFTYWDYQRLSFAKRMGMRIDFTLATPALAARAVGASIDRQERKGKGASDHAPVVVEFGPGTSSADPAEIPASGADAGERG
ncbi:exodeoxyribonuclease III [Nakamurella flavida]|uniref:Exodeoxyribonuclease III n=1 Tax=Nakamurella flavida TaxID=363630 RepID=A0A938YHQ1_9ACTN|nr:exodeoxyribonuclease III [Nakamurella flavida]